VPNTRTESVDSPENGRRKVFGASMHVTYDFNDSTLTSISSYRGYTSAYAFDSDGTPEPIDAQNDVDNANLFTQELRLTSKGNGPFQWIVGAYYSHQRLVDDFHTLFLPEIGVLFGLPPFPSDYFDEGNSRGEIKSDSYALYASGTWNITSRWSLAGGLRYSMDKKSLTYNQGLEALTGSPLDAAGLVLAYTPPGGVASKLDEHVPTGDVSVAYKVTDDQSAYIKFSRGYKAGGFNAYLVTAPFNYATTGLAFKPEYLNNYEAGYKASWWDGRMTMNGDVFYDDYTNKQEAVENPALLELIVENAAGARIYGAELETEIQPVDGLIFDGSLGLLNAEYDAFKSAIGGTLTGNELPSAPHLEYTLAATYEREIPSWSGWDAMARLEVTHTDSSYSDPQNTPGYVNGPVTYLNGRVGVSNGNWAFFLWGKNLTNQYHLTGGLFEDVATARAVNEPRTWGGELTYKF
jgi:iron complex outermembrane receptor protein